MSEVSKEALRDNVDAEVLRLINRVIQAQLDKGDEDAFPAIYRLTGVKSEVLTAFIGTIMNVKVEPAELYANLIAVGAILAAEFQRRLVSIDRANHTLPDETTFVDGGACTYCGAVWYGLPPSPCPSCGKATMANDGASKGGQ